VKPGGLAGRLLQRCAALAVCAWLLDQAWRLLRPLLPGLTALFIGANVLTWLVGPYVGRRRG
jgi:hypothetical protein